MRPIPRITRGSCSYGVLEGAGVAGGARDTPCMGAVEVSPRERRGARPASWTFQSWYIFLPTGPSYWVQGAVGIVLLEVDFHCKLQNSRILGARDLSEGRLIQSHVGCIKIGVVEHVEGFGAHFQV